MIGDFDQISGAPDVLVGRHNLSDDLVVRAVVREGDEAVAPLLECLERDDRLTRNVYRDERRPNRNSYIQGDDEAAYAAVCSILGTRQFGSASFLYRGIVARPMRVAAAAEIRAYWERTRGSGPLRACSGRWPMTPRRAINGWKRPRSWPGRATSTAGTTRTRFAIVSARNPRRSRANPCAVGSIPASPSSSPAESESSIRRTGLAARRLMFTRRIDWRNSWPPGTPGGPRPP